jgi:hypothetical protein
MTNREYGFMGEPFPSIKFQRVMAEYLGHIEPEEFIHESIQKITEGPTTSDIGEKEFIHKSSIKRLMNQLQS